VEPSFSTIGMILIVLAGGFLSLCGEVDGFNRWGMHSGEHLAPMTLKFSSVQEQEVEIFEVSELPYRMNP